MPIYKDVPAIVFGDGDIAFDGALTHDGEGFCLFLHVIEPVGAGECVPEDVLKSLPDTPSDAYIEFKNTTSLDVVARLLSDIRDIMVGSQEKS